MDQNSKEDKFLRLHAAPKTDLHLLNSIVQALCSIWLLASFSVSGYWYLNNDCVAMLHRCLTALIKKHFSEHRYTDE